MSVVGRGGGGHARLRSAGRQSRMGSDPEAIDFLEIFLRYAEDLFVLFFGGRVRWQRQTRCVLLSCLVELWLKEEAEI